MKIDNLGVNQTLYDVSHEYLGNTLLRSTVVRLVRVISIAEDRQSFVASWNSNSPRTYRRIPPSWRVKKPILVEGHPTFRLALRYEIKTGRLVEMSTYYRLYTKEMLDA